MRTPTLAALGAVIVLAACGGAASDDASARDASATAVMTEVQRAAAIANAITAAPARMDSILAANGMTAEQLEQMMYRIARDSALSAEYGRLTSR
jgi:hypothetical protein